MGKRIKIRLRISKELRLAVFRRDRFICGYCKDVFKSKNLEPDHIIPVKPHGGKTTIKNLVTACKKCNRHKKHRLPRERNAPKLERHAGKVVAKTTLRSPILRSVLREPKISHHR